MGDGVLAEQCEEVLVDFFEAVLAVYEDEGSAKS